MEVSTIDRPGVLSRIGMAMDMCGQNYRMQKLQPMVNALKISFIYKMMKIK